MHSVTRDNPGERDASEGVNLREPARRTSGSAKDTAGSQVGECSVGIDVRGLKKTFARADGTRVHAVADISLEVDHGEIVVLLGPSGCGKTTLLRCIAGLESADEGQISVNGALMFSASDKLNVPTEKRNVSMVFQSYALWPHFDVFKNVAYPLRCRNVDKRQCRERVEAVLEMVGIPELAHQMPSSLSGGQQQRVALARSLAVDPKVIVFDEPLSNVDAKVREILRNEILAMHRRLGFAGLYVTHDQEEAMRMGNRVAVMKKGSIEQIGSPRDIYGKPRTRYVATFVGTMNEWEGRVEEVGPDGLAVMPVEGGSLVIEPDSLPAGAPDARLVAGVRPEKIVLSRASQRNTQGHIAGRIESVSFVGTFTEYLVRCGQQDIVVVARDWTEEFEVGELVTASISPSDLLVFPL